ncbi:MAG: AEC family transporter [Parafilimonas terrae]|nr:AEC family transporter [Parafilimonas terrae]
MIGLIVSALLPVIVTLLLGAIAGWRHDADAKAAGALNVMVLRYALPLSLFVGTMAMPAETLLQDGSLVLLLLAFLLGPFALVFAISRFVARRSLSAAALQALAVSFPALPFTGIPILTPLVGDVTTVLVAAGGIATNLVLVPFTLLILSVDEHGSGGAKTSLGATMVGAILEPVVLAPVLALVLVFAGVRLPLVLLDSFKLLGSAVGGVALFSAGVVLQAQRPSFSWPVAATVLGHVTVPFAAILVLHLLGASADVTKALALALALPGAAIVVILAVRYRVNPQEGATFLLLSNVMCVPAIALTLLLLG